MVPTKVGDFSGHISFFEEGVAAPIGEASVHGMGIVPPGIAARNPGCSCALSARRSNSAGWAILVTAIVLFAFRRARRLGLFTLAIGALCIFPSLARADDASARVFVVPSGPIDFGAIPVGTPSDPQPIGIKNISAAPITLGTPTSDSPAYQVDTTGFEPNLAVNATTTIHVMLVPQAMGTVTGHVSFFENGVTAPIAEVALTGIGGFFGRVVTKDGCSCALAAPSRPNGAAWVFLVAAIAGIARRRSRGAGLFLLAFFLAVPALAHAENVSITPGSLEFGAVPVGSPSDPRTVTIKNLSNAPLSLGDIDGNSTDFVVDATDFKKDLLPGATTTASVVFVPSVAGDAADRLQIKLADGSVLAIAVRGSGQQHQTAVGCNVARRPSFGDFARLFVPIFAATILLIGFRRGRRWGLFVLAIGSLLSIPSLASADDGGDGIAVVPSTTVDFEGVTVGSPSDPQPIGLKNVSTVPKVLASAMSDSPDFQIDETGFTKNLAVGGTSILHVTFVPTVAGARSGHLFFYEQAVPAPFAELSVLGTGLPVTQQHAHGVGCDSAMGPQLPWWLVLAVALMIALAIVVHGARAKRR
jgi:MYXO-CTERM domain-containing protein